jgi:hypothetical protein
MVQLRVSPHEAEAFLGEVEHSTFHKGKQKYWILSEDGHIKAQSILWFFCWAKTGMNSNKTAVVCRRIFDMIFPFSYSHFKSTIPHDYARHNRYSTENLDNELRDMLGGRA